MANRVWTLAACLVAACSGRDPPRGEERHARDLEATAAEDGGARCVAPERSEATVIPQRAEAMLDLLFAAFLCDRVQVGSALMGYSGYHWRYQWVDGVRTDDIHDDVHHKADRERDAYTRSTRWDWKQFAGFVDRLKRTPEGDGSMLMGAEIAGLGNDPRCGTPREIAG